MGMKKIIVENWITRKLPEGGHRSTLFLVSLLVAGTALFLNDVKGLGSLMPASFETVVVNHQYYRLWSALFAHADLEHIMSNLFLFVPFAYLLANYFSLWLFPLIGFFLGGLINLIVVHYLGGNINIIGVSGVVYWMGAAWMSLSFFIDRRESLLSRFIKLSGVSLILFFPTTFLPEVSYLSHFLGYLFGLFSGAVVYLLFRKRFLAAEIVHEVDEEKEYFDWENFDVNNLHFPDLTHEEVPVLKKWLERDHIARAFIPRADARVLMIKSGVMPLGFLQLSPGHDGQIRVEPFIADRRLLSRGLGSTILRKFTDEKDHEAGFMAEVSPANGAAIRAFKKAGFIRSSTMFATGGPSVLLTKVKYT